MKHRSLLSLADIGQQALFTSMPIQPLDSQNGTQQSARQRRWLRLTQRQQKEPCRICLKETSYGANSFTSRAETTSGVNDSINSNDKKAVATKAQRRQRQSQTANSGLGAGLTIKQRQNFGINPGSNGYTRTGGGKARAWVDRMSAFSIGECLLGKLRSLTCSPSSPKRRTP